MGTHWSDVVFFKWGVSATTKAEKAASDAAKGLTFSGERITDPDRSGDENADPNDGGATARYDPDAYVEVDELD